MNNNSADMIRKAVLEAATNNSPGLSGPLGEPNPARVDLRKLTIDLCESFEIIDGYLTSKQQA